MNEIAIIGYFGWYGSMAEWISDGFDKLGFKVIKYDRKLLPIIGSQHQLYLFVDCSEDYSSQIPKLDGLKVFWSMDSQMPGGIERSTNIARKCDIVFCSNKEHGVNLLKKFGINSHLLPVTYNDYLIKNSDIRKDLDIVMIGHNNSSQRIKLFNLIKQYYPNSFVGRAEEKNEYMNSMCRAKIIINQPTEPFDNILNNRFFEAMASGALLLQKKLKTTLIDDLGFVEEEHFIYWNNFNELFMLVEYYLRDEKSRLEITKKAYRDVQEYSMSNQCRKMIDIINKK
jgi:hypothetical protein